MSEKKFVMWEDIREQIENGDYAHARALINKEKANLIYYDDIFAILEASVCEAEQKREAMFDAIARGLSCNPLNYELYYMLGRFYYDTNPDQTFLCFQNALYYCKSAEDRSIIQGEIDNLRYLHEITVKNTAIVIVSYNSCYLLQKNIESIRNTLPEKTYRMIVVDNASDDGVVEWLEKQDDILLIKNNENRGFPCACNQGSRVFLETEFEGSDLFFLNNDTRLAINSLFWLRMGLYENKKTGATGSYSNYAGNEQQLDVAFTLPCEYLEYGAKHNIPLKYPYEERVRLSGFAMLVRRCVWDAIGGMDEKFTPGYFEDDDLCMGILKQGYRIRLCRNSYIYHAGSQSFSYMDNVNEVLLAHHRLFIQKYGFDILDYAIPQRDFIEKIPFPQNEEFNGLQVGSGLGADLKLLRTYYPLANIVGLETDTALFEIAGSTETIFRNVGELSNHFKYPVFDLLIINPRVYTGLLENEKKTLMGLCKIDCVVLL